MPEEGSLAYRRKRDAVDVFLHAAKIYVHDCYTHLRYNTRYQVYVGEYTLGE